MSRFASYSEWAAFLDCRSRWYVDYPLRRPRGPSHPSRRLGSLFEACFAAKLRGWAVTVDPKIKLAPQQYRGWRLKGADSAFAQLATSPERAFGKDIEAVEFGTFEGPPEVTPHSALLRKCTEEQWPYHEDYGGTEEAGELALALTERAFDLIGFSSGRFRPAVVNGVAAIQLRLECPLPPDPDPSRVGGRTGGYYAGIRGIPDLVVLDGERDWRPVLGDTKVRGGLGEVDLGCDPQLAIYQYLLERNGLRVVECEQWGILNKMPVEPPLTKSTKKVSRDAEHPTTPELYEAACHRNGEKPDPGHMEKLTAKRWHVATPGGGTDAEVARTIEELCADLELMAALATTPDADWQGGLAPITRNNRTWAGAPCQRCDVRSECHETKSRGLPLAAAFAPEQPKPERTIEQLEQEVME